MTLYKQDISHAKSIIPEELWQSKERLGKAALCTLQDDIKNNKLPFFSLPDSQNNELNNIISQAENIIATGCKDLVLVGTGGSSLGSQTLASLVESVASDSQQPSYPKLHILDNTDPATAKNIYDIINPETTVFMLISKSGKTIEVLSHALIALKFMQKLSKAELPKHFVVITEPKPSPLRTLAEKHQLNILDHHPDIGGRYSVLSIVGLLPAACLGVDIADIITGAKTTLDETINAKITADSAPALGAVLQTAHLDDGRSTHVLMPYCDKLNRFGRWYQQLMAESLGKNGTGITPFTAQGAVHQHSLLQLFLDGQDDKLYTLISLEHAGFGKSIPVNSDISEISYLANHHLGDIIHSQQIGTAETLRNHSRPLRIIKLGSSLNAKTLGALLMHWMIEVIISADIMNVNPYDQPAVEQGKTLAKKYLENL